MAQEQKLDLIAKTENFDKEQIVGGSPVNMVIIFPNQRSKLIAFHENC
jgi:hypothetical protein